MGEKFLEEFFAVTKTSVYRVSSQKDEKGFPVVEKIALRGESAVPVGGRLHNGHLVGIMKTEINLYYEDYSPFSGRREQPQRPEEVNIHYWGGHTSPIVALFLNKEEAMSCFNSENQKNCDPRWRKQTEETLGAIGDNHPVFIPSISHSISYD